MSATAPREEGHHARGALVAPKREEILAAGGASRAARDRVGRQPGAQQLSRDLLRHVEVELTSPALQALRAGPLGELLADGVAAGADARADGGRQMGFLGAARQDGLDAL